MLRMSVAHRAFLVFRVDRPSLRRLGALRASSGHAARAYQHLRRLLDRDTDCADLDVRGAGGFDHGYPDDIRFQADQRVCVTGLVMVRERTD